VSTWKKNHCILMLLKLNAIIFYLIDYAIPICRLLLYSVSVLILITMSLPEEQPPFEEPLSPIGRMQSGLAASFITPSPKKNHGDGDQFVDGKPFIDKRKPLSTMVERGVLNNGEHTLIPVTARMIHSAIWNSEWFV
jgi:hypothetical protein